MLRLLLRSLFFLPKVSSFETFILTILHGDGVLRFNFVNLFGKLMHIMFSIVSKAFDCAGRFSIFFFLKLVEPFLYVYLMLELIKLCVYIFLIFFLLSFVVMQFFLCNCFLNLSFLLNQINAIWKVLVRFSFCSSFCEIHRVG